MNNRPQKNSPKWAIFPIYKIHTKLFFPLITITMVITFNLFQICIND